jgi:hypothetical protein
VFGLLRVFPSVCDMHMYRIGKSLGQDDILTKGKHTRQNLPNPQIPQLILGGLILPRPRRSRQSTDLIFDLCARFSDRVRVEDVLTIGLPDGCPWGRRLVFCCVGVEELVLYALFLQGRNELGVLLCQALVEDYRVVYGCFAACPAFLSSYSIPLIMRKRVWAQER